MTPGRPHTTQHVLWVPNNLAVALADCTLNRPDNSDVLSQGATAGPEKEETAADSEAATGPADDSKTGPADDSKTSAAGCSD